MNVRCGLKLELLQIYIELIRDLISMKYMNPGDNNNE